MTSQTPPDKKSGGVFVLLTLLCALLHLPGLAMLPPIDRDEARFMQATKQMIEAGDYAHITFQTEPRDKKPIGAYWAQAASVRLFGQSLTTPWPYRLPSVLGVWLAVLVTAWGVARVATPQTGFVAGAILATTVLTTIEAHLAKADALLLGASAVVFAGLLQARLHRVSAVMRYAFWAALGASVLVKGPVLPAVLVLALAALYAADKSLAWMTALKPAISIMITLTVVAIWPLVVGLDEVTRFAASAFSQDLLPKLTAGQESHGAPPGLHAVMSFATLWPWGFAVPFAAVAAWRNGTSPLVRLCAAWILPFWFVLEIVPTKLPHYMLPLFPAIAVLIAMPITSRLAWSPRKVIAVGLGGLAAFAFLVAGAISVFNLPTWHDVTLSARLAAALEPHRDAAPVVLVGYSEPSAVFLLATNTFTTNPQHAGEVLASGGAHVGAVSENDLSVVGAIVREAGKNLIRLGNVSGYNYSRGQWVTLVIVQTAP
jgi:4-amino-4-deoxy-L-arabinose transferase-like glycosyltransferase